MALIVAGFFLIAIVDWRLSLALGLIIWGSAEYGQAIDKGE
jgi:hypothetical protein